MTTNIDMRLASTRVNTTLYTDNAMPRLFTPGEVITSQQGFMRYVSISHVSCTETLKLNSTCNFTGDTEHM